MIAGFNCLSFQECVILLMAHWINHDEINVINILGLLCCLAGIGVHVYLKATKSKLLSLSILCHKKIVTYFSSVHCLVHNQNVCRTEELDCLL